MLDESASLGVLLELEIGVVGGTEDGLPRQEAQYSEPEDMVSVAERLGTGERGRYLLAPALGNVHGLGGHQQADLCLSILKEGQQLVADRFGESARHYLVFHGGSGSTLEEIREAIDHGVVKMNINTDIQCAFTDGVRSQLSSEAMRSCESRGLLGAGEMAVAEEIAKVCDDLLSAGRSLTA